MKDDNILLEALKDIKAYPISDNTRDHFFLVVSILKERAIRGITEYNQSPSDETSKMLSECQNIDLHESNQDELEYDYFNAIGSKARGDDFTFYPHVIAELKSQYSIKKK